MVARVCGKIGKGSGVEQGEFIRTKYLRLPRPQCKVRFTCKRAIARMHELPSLLQAKAHTLGIPWARPPSCDNIVHVRTSPDTDETTSESTSVGMLASATEARARTTVQKLACTPNAGPPVYKNTHVNKPPSDCYLAILCACQRDLAAPVSPRPAQAPPVCRKLVPPACCPSGTIPKHK